jgi:hypothetical protein
LLYCVWQEPGFSRRKDVFTYNSILNTLYKCCTFNVICEGIAMHYFVQHKNDSFLSTLMGHTLGLFCKSNTSVVNRTSLNDRKYKHDILGSWMLARAFTSLFYFNFMLFTTTSGSLHLVLLCSPHLILLIFFFYFHYFSSAPFR